MAAVEVVPSPKFQLYETMLPSLSVEVLVKLAVRPLVATLKFATGAALLPPPATAATAAAALTMPLPMAGLCVAGNARNVLFSVLSTCAGVSGVVATDCISATTPATCGDAIEVPAMHR